MQLYIHLNTLKYMKHHQILIYKERDELRAKEEDEDASSSPKGTSI